MNKQYYCEHDVTHPLSARNSRKNWLEKILGKKTKKAILYGNISALIFFSGTGIVSADPNNGGAYNVDSQLTITNEDLKDYSVTSYGGAIYVASGGDLTLSNVSFTNNTAALGGGAIAIVAGGKISSATEVTFTGNKDTAGYGGTINNEGTIDNLDKITITGSTTRYNGGAIRNVGTIKNMSNVYFADNEAANKGSAGGAIWNRGTIEKITVGTFEENKSTGAGGAINNQMGSTIGEISKINFIENSTQNTGGAIYNDPTATIGIIDTVNFIKNTAPNGASSGTAGALMNNGTITTISNTNFTENEADVAGGGIHNGHSGIITTLKTINFTGNISGNGGGAICNYGTISTMDSIIFFKNENTNYNGGGAVDNNGTINSIINVSFTENKAINGPGNSGGFGGAILNSSTIGKIDNVSFIGNTADFYGGAISNRYNLNNIVNVSFIENTAARYGGAIHNSGSGTISAMEEVSFIKNESTWDGGAIYNNGTMIINSGIFSGNMAFGVPNSIFNEKSLTLNPDTDQVLDMRDPMTGFGGTTTKTGAGIWLLGGNSEIDSSAKLNINEGTLYLYRENEVDNPNKNNAAAKVESGNIYLTSSNSSFVLAAGANLMLGIGDIAHNIQAGSITLETDSYVSVNYDSAFITNSDIFDNAEKRYDVLYLQEKTTLTNNSTVIDKDGILELGAYNYAVEAKWNEADGNDILSLYSKDSGTFDPDRGGSHIVRIPEAIAIHNPTNEVIINRQKALFTDKEGVFGDIKKQNRHFWGTGFYNFSHMDQHSGIAGYNLKTPGFALGYDDYIGKKHFLGVAVTASWPDYHGGNSSADGNDVRLAIYGGAKLNHNWELSYMAGYGWADLDQDRHYKGYKYSADYDFDTLSFAIGLAKQFKRSESSFVRPYVHYEYMKIDVDSYKESGEGPYGLGLESRNSDIDRVRVGFDYVKQATENKNKYWRAGLFWQGQYGDTTPKAWAYFNSNPSDSRFMSYAGTEDRDSLGVTLGWGTPMGKNSDFHLSYTGLYGAKSDTQDFGMTFVRRF